MARAALARAERSALAAAHWQGMVLSAMDSTAEQTFGDWQVMPRGRQRRRTDPFRFGEREGNHWLHPANEANGGRFRRRKKATNEKGWDWQASAERRLTVDSFWRGSRIATNDATGGKKKCLTQDLAGPGARREVCYGTLTDKKIGDPRFGLAWQKWLPTLNRFWANLSLWLGY